MTDMHVASIAHPHDYVAAVQRLQELLGVPPDGLIGPRTRAAAYAVGYANREILPRLERIEHRIYDMTQKMDAFIAAFAAFVTKLDAFITAANANQANSDALVAAAVKAEQDGQDVSVAALQASLDAEAAKVPDAPVAPPTPPPAV